MASYGCSETPTTKRITAMQQYLTLMKDILDNGERMENRTGIDTLSLFGRQLHFDLTKGFPLVTTKKTHTKSIIHELLWMLSGSSNISYLKEHGVKIWDAWASKDYRPELGLPDGDIGPGYGVTWRSWGGYVPGPPLNEEALCERFNELTPEERIEVIAKWTKRLKKADVAVPVPPAETKDEAAYVLRLRQLYREARPIARNGYGGGIDQISDIVDKLRNKPQDRRIILSAWNVADIPKMKLPPCHLLAQFSVRKAGLACHMYIRSWDFFLGGPFNIAQYALLTNMLAHVAEMPAAELIISAGDVHLYVNHLEQAQLQLTRDPKKLPTLWLNPGVEEIDDFAFDDIRVDNYEHHPHIKGEVAV